MVKSYLSSALKAMKGVSGAGFGIASFDSSAHTPLDTGLAEHDHRRSICVEGVEGGALALNFGSKPNAHKSGLRADSSPSYNFVCVSFDSLVL